jgi:hypothetical protein
MSLTLAAAPSQAVSSRCWTPRAAPASSWAVPRGFGRDDTGPPAGIVLRGSPRWMLPPAPCAKAGEFSQALRSVPSGLTPSGYHSGRQVMCGTEGFGWRWVRFKEGGSGLFCAGWASKVGSFGNFLGRAVRPLNSSTAGRQGRWRNWRRVVVASEETSCVVSWKKI